jgi:hypothetical protein
MSDKPAKPELDVWDSCCLIGVLNKEQDKLPALLAQMQYFESGKAILGIPTTAVTEVVTLSDGTPAEPKLKEFLDNHYVELLQPTLDISLMSGKLQFRFDSKRTPEVRAKALAAAIPRDQASRLKSRDSEILATALVYKAQRLTTYDPYLVFLGKEYITPETGLVISPPDSSWLNFDQETE